MDIVEELIKKNKDQTYGYPIREPYESEKEYFSGNPNVAGMATEDKSIILNPFRTFTDMERKSVLKNEAIRLWLKDKSVVPDFMITPEQKMKFAGTPYEKDELALKHSIISRILSGDPSVGNITTEQQGWADKILLQLEPRYMGGEVSPSNERGRDMMNPNLQRLIELLGESMKPSHGYTIAETAPEVVTAPGVYFPAEKGEVIPMQSREKGGEVNPSNPSGDNEKERLGMLKDILFKVNPNQPKLESQQPKLESRQAGGPVSPEGEPYVDPIQKAQMDILKTIAQALKTPAPPEGWGSMKTGMGLSQRTSGYGSPSGPSMFSNQGSPGLPTPESYSMKPMALKDSDMDRISREKGLASTGEELWQRKRSENQIPLIPAQEGENVVPTQEDEYEKLRRLIFGVRPGERSTEDIGPMGETTTNKAIGTLGPERFFTGGKEVPPSTRGAVSGEELVRQRFGQEEREREAMLNKMAQPGSYYEAHPEERMMDIEWERTKPLRDIITQAIEREKTREQGYGLGFGPTPLQRRLGARDTREGPSQMPALIEELRRTSGGEVPGRGTTNMGLGTPHLVQNESGQYQWTYPPSTTQPKGAVLPAGVTAKATPKNQQPYITPEGKTVLVDTSSPDAQRIINEGKLKPAPLAAAETKANIWSIVPNATSGAYFDKGRKKWFVDTTEGEKELTSDEVKTLNLQIKEQTPTETTKTMQQTAPKVLVLASRVKADLAKEVGNLGPAVSRWRDFWAGTVGAPDPGFTKLMTDVGLLSTLLMRMHVGARGGVQIMDHFKGMMDAGKLSPENLSAAIDTIINYANDVNKPMVGGESTSPPKKVWRQRPDGTWSQE